MLRRPPRFRRFGTAAAAAAAGFAAVPRRTPLRPAPFRPAPFRPAAPAPRPAECAGTAGGGFAAPGSRGSTFTDAVVGSGFQHVGRFQTQSTADAACRPASVARVPSAQPARGRPLSNAERMHPCFAAFTAVPYGPLARRIRPTDVCFACDAASRTASAWDRAGGLFKHAACAAVAPLCLRPFRHRARLVRRRLGNAGGLLRGVGKGGGGGYAAAHIAAERNGGDGAAA